MENVNERLKKDENVQKVVTAGEILCAGFLMAVESARFVAAGDLVVYEALIAVIAMMSSFGPTAALSALSNNLHHALASGNRVLDILEEEPVVEDVIGRSDVCEGDIRCENICFAYGDAAGLNQADAVSVHRADAAGSHQAGTASVSTDSAYKADFAVLTDFNAVFSENHIHGILGKSGCGKSTLLKLLMHFYETDCGDIFYGIENVHHINTSSLRGSISYVTQETFLFHDTIENNIRVAKEDATREEVIAAARKASIHDFIMSLPEGYDTRLAELGDSISGGEKQRIGIARAFLHESSMIFLDEPTSNIDSLNEGIILKSLEEEKENKTILLVSHRKSTMGIVDDMIAM